jgi:hypothetical protein
MNYLFFQHDWVGTVACSGDVWADEDMNILRISEDLELPPSKNPLEKPPRRGVVRLAEKKQGRNPRLSL